MSRAIYYGLMYAVVIGALATMVATLIGLCGWLLATEVVPIFRCFYRPNTLPC